MLAMVAVGLWAGLNGGRALWAWPVAFVGVMVLGGALGISGFAVPMVEAGILASVVVLGLLVLAAAQIAGGRRRDSGRGLRSAARTRPRRRASRRSCRGHHLRRRLRHRHRHPARHRHRRFPDGLPAPTAGSPCAARVRWWPPPASPWRSPRRPRMIPGEVITAPGDIELNAGRAGDHAHDRQHRRPADPGRLALSLRRDQQGADSSIAPRPAATASTSPPARPCASSPARRATCNWCRSPATAACSASKAR